ncbi:hypothetical protein M422DRAFT_255862 [Sphaerobolus stellatus SS14]|uniref:Uncharacterized protein n=1 Tax=Sphaerobolus stellatus (strain SS14) TaxID=990650 RepID=A0A0C9VHX2_SPHS4|nr:hypothetical protein M422DRAFT_255862 [Sphaerobolus stellatus SS14]
MPSSVSKTYDGGKELTFTPVALGWEVDANQNKASKILSLRGHGASSELKAAYEKTKPRAVERAIYTSLEVTPQIGKEVLSLASDTLTFVPVMGLDVVAKTLLRIWNTIDLVEVCQSALLP